VEKDELLTFFDDDDRKKHFGDKRSSLAVRPITNADREADLRDAVAQRLYQLRCKIVHTKDAGGDGEIDLLLPNSAEARLLARTTSILHVSWRLALSPHPQRLSSSSYFPRIKSLTIATRSPSGAIHPSAAVLPSYGFLGSRTSSGVFPREVASGGGT
jgi:hypothetical protein